MYDWRELFKKTRPEIISGLIKAVREDPELVTDETTLLEMLTFVRNEEFRPEAEAGAHDDCVMSLAIAHYIRPQQSYAVEIEEKAYKDDTEPIAYTYDEFMTGETAGADYLRF